MKLINKSNLFGGQNVKEKQALAIEYLKDKYSEECERENTIVNNCNLLVAVVSILMTVFMQVICKLLEIYPNNIKFLLTYVCVSFWLLFSSVIVAMLVNLQYNDKISRKLIDYKNINNNLIMDDLNKKYLNILNSNVKKNYFLLISYGLLLAFIVFTFLCALIIIL